MVFSCKHLETGQIRACKQIRKQRCSRKKDLDSFINEVRLLQSLDHPNIVKLFEVFNDSSQLYIVTELCQGGELFDEIVKRKCFTEEDARVVMRQFLLAIAHCHSMNIVHRDLKPENIVLVEATQIKIIDFGIAMVLDPAKGIR